MDYLLERYESVRARTERLAASLTAEDQAVQSMPDVSPTKWHQAHTSWFFHEFVLRNGASLPPAWDDFRFLFNSYYDAVGARHPRPERGLITRPSLAEVQDYRAEVDDLVTRCLRGGAPESIACVVELGTHHEEQHQELLLMDIKHVLSKNPAMSPAYASVPSVPASDPGPLGWVEFDGGLTDIGHAEDTFSFDNEGPPHEVRLYDFALGDRLVTSGEWLEFIADGGYQRPNLWKSDGWAYAQAERWAGPLYWRSGETVDTWQMHTLTGVRDVDPHEPVTHVSHYEADAYATWSGARLPTEFEWEHASLKAVADGTFLDDVDPEFSFHPTAAGPSTGGLRQLFGDCWEWTSSAYQPYPGFRPAAGAIGEYNGKFMSGQQVLRGGSALTPRGHVRRTYRNFFHPQARWQMGGVRLSRV